MDNIFSEIYKRYNINLHELKYMIKIGKKYNYSYEEIKKMIIEILDNKK